jgi:maleate isomerase
MSAIAQPTSEAVTPARVDRRRMPYVLDGGVGYRARIGVVVLASDFTIEHELARLLDVPGVALYHSRVDNDAVISAESLARMEARIASSTALITPGAPLDVVVYGCTSGTLVIGEANVHARIREARPGIACTTPMEAALAALAALGARRIALIAPYVDALNQRMRAHLMAHGVDVPVMGSWNIEDDNAVARLSAETMRDAVLELGADDAVDAVFVSCTNVRLAAQLEALERSLGKPVTSSNHATAWHALRLAGVADALSGRGRLFREPL